MVNNKLSYAQLVSKTTARISIYVNQKTDLLKTK